MQFPFIPYMAGRYIRQYNDKTLLIEKIYKYASELRFFFCIFTL